jgi:ApbE superfamily uncharacterized protein (UPF0280 family)
MDRDIYRDWVNSEGLVKVVVSEKETDLCIMADKDLSKEAKASILKHRGEIEEYIKKNPDFKDSLEPVEISNAPPGLPDIIKNMASASRAAGVGPMASVAGAMAERVGTDLLAFSKEIIVENGGDIYLRSLKNRTFGVYAGGSPLTGKIRFEIMAEDTPVGVCTSSGSVGHSLSFGRADAACIISKDTALADAVATKTGNIVKKAEDIEAGIDFARSVPGVTAAIVIVGDRFGTWGKVRLLC